MTKRIFLLTPLNNEKNSHIVPNEAIKEGIAYNTRSGISDFKFNVSMFNNWNNKIG
jgi:hypothetical protein